jgi:hypothetical protein
MHAAMDIVLTLHFQREDRMRRRLARGRGRLMRRGAGARIPVLLTRSNELLEGGQFAEAADGLEKLARAAEARGGRRAAKFYIEAGRARLIAGRTDDGIALMQRGFSLLAASHRDRGLARSGRRVISDLEGRGRTQEAQQVSAFLKTLAPDFEAVSTKPETASRVPLPTRCPECGGPVHPGEVEWLDENTAECEYCGNPLRGE